MAGRKSWLELAIFLPAGKDSIRRRYNSTDATAPILHIAISRLGPQACLQPYLQQLANQPPRSSTRAPITLSILLSLVETAYYLPILTPVYCIIFACFAF